MKKIIIRAGILLAIFIATVTATTLLLNKQNTDDTNDLDAATLPEMMVEINGSMVNRMYGYVREMQVDFTRDSLTPVNTSKEITVAVRPFDQEIQGLSYEVQSSDGSKVLENQTVKNLHEEDNYLKADISLTADDMLMNQEYTLKLQLDLETGSVYYYTRIVQRTRLNTSKYIDFVEGFYQKCLNKDASDELVDYIEPDSSVSNSSYTNVSLHSSLDMITWGDLAPQISRKGIPVIKDINETTGSITLEYQIQAKDTEGNIELYEVEDFYRMRYTQERVMLLDFQREAQQIYDGSLPVTDEQGVILGVTPRDVEYVCNPSADIAAFVVNGDLWSYSRSASKMTKVFSFRNDSDSDERDDHPEHDIKVLRVDESGDMDFVLFGYMNRGAHEGYVGTGVYHYSSSQNAVSEEIFIPSTLSYEFLKRDLERLSYVNEKDQMFLLTEGSLYQIDLGEKEYKVIQEDINGGSFVTSSTGARAAWTNGNDADAAASISEMDFDSADIRTLDAEDGKYIKALGYMNEDLIYGIATAGNVLVNSDGDMVFAMDEIKIEEFDGSVKKEYTKEDMYITSVNITESLMEMQLSQKKKNSYTYKTTENIMNNKKAVEEQVTLNTQYSNRRGYVMRLDFQEAMQVSKPVVVAARVKSVLEGNVLDMDIKPLSQEAYYVYAFGKLDSIYTDPAQAILRADEQTGVVLNRDQQYVWERGNVRTKIQLNETDIPEEVLAGTLDVETLSEALGDGTVVLDLTGCTLEQVLYEVSMQRPVIVATGNGNSLVIIGYDQYNTIVYNPKTKETGYMGLNDSTTAFEAAGNTFITYIDVL